MANVPSVVVFRGARGFGNASTRRRSPDNRWKVNVFKEQLIPSPKRVAIFPLQTPTTVEKRLSD